MPYDYDRISDDIYWKQEYEKQPSLENYFALHQSYQYQENPWEQLQTLDLIIDTYENISDTTQEVLYARSWLARCDLSANINGDAFLDAEGYVYGYYPSPTPDMISTDTLYDDLIKRYEDSDDAELREIAQISIYKKQVYQSQYFTESERITLYKGILDALRLSDSVEYFRYRLFMEQYLLHLECDRTSTLWRIRVDEIHAPYIHHDDLDIRLACARFYSFFVYSNIPTENIEIIDAFIKNFGDIALHTIQTDCIGLLYQKADTLDETLDEKPGAIATYSQIIDRTYAEWRNMGYRAIVKKGCLLGRMRRFDEAIEVCDMIIRDTRIDLREDTLSRTWWMMAVGNQIEYLMLTGQSVRVREQCELLTLQSKDNHKEEYVIANFCLWLMSDSLEPISPDILVELSTPMGWGFDETRLYLETVPQNKKIQAEAYIGFFEGKITREQLKVILGGL